MIRPLTNTNFLWNFELFSLFTTTTNRVNVTSFFLTPFGYPHLIHYILYNKAILGAPFLLTFPIPYIHMSFDMGRQFFYKWTVNWRCVPEELFLAKPFQIALLVLHVVVLLAFLSKALRNVGGLTGVFAKRRPLKLSADSVIFLMFISNYIGVVFSRSLHYQFYVWYYHSIAYLLWSTQLPSYAK